MRKKESIGSRVFDILNILIMFAMILITLYPFYYVVTCSLSESSRLIGDKGLMLIPKGFSLEAYKKVIENPNIFTGYKTTIFIVIVGTFINIAMTSLGAFVLTRKRFALKNIMTYMIIFTMYFNGGLIPTYLLVYKTLHLGNTLWAVILPGAVSTYNLIIMRTNFAAIPDSLEEAAKIDGAREITVFLKIILPLSKSIIAVMVLFYGVAHWNSWFNAMIYLRERSLYPLQLVLREILLLNTEETSTMSSGVSSAEKYMIGESIRYATIMVATVPILCVYPFVQKYFVKGMMIGAVKG